MNIKESATAGLKGLATYVIAVGLFSRAVWADPTPVLQYTFNEIGSVATGTGSAGIDLAMMKLNGSTWISNDNHGAAGSGVSGLAGDLAYYDTSLSYVNLGNEDSHYQGGFLGSHPLDSAVNLNALTIQGWFRTPAGQPIGKGESTLLGNLGTIDSNGGWKLATRGDSNPDYIGRLSFWAGTVDFTGDIAQRVVSDSVFTETDQWVFFAMTYTPGANLGQVQYYKGTTTSAITTAGTNYTDILRNNAIAASDRGFYIGNGGNEGSSWFQARAFNGKLDNIRVFNSVLTPTQIEALRQADLAPTLPAPPAAAVLASTNFNSNSVGSPLVTQGGGSGWSTNWAGDPSLTSTVATNLVVSNTSGTRAEVLTSAGNGGLAYRGLATPLADTANNTVYVRFDAQNLNDGTRFFGLSLFSGTNERMLIGQGTGFTDWTINNLAIAAPGTAHSNIDTSAAANLLVKIVFGGQNAAESVTFWVNPNYSQSESSAANLAAKIGQFTTFADWGTIDRIRIGGGNTSGINLYAAHWLDDLAIGASSPFASLAGDFNSDGKVDSGDYVAWRKNSGNSALPNDNGLTTQAARYSLWRANFGNPSSGAGASAGFTTAIPEPSALSLCAILLPLASCAWRRATTRRF